MTLKDVDLSVGITVPTFSKASEGEAAFVNRCWTPPCRQLSFQLHVSERKCLSLRERETCTDDVAFSCPSN